MRTASSPAFVAPLIATVAIGAAANAGLLAVQILAAHDPALLARMLAYKEELAAASRAKNAGLAAAMSNEQ